MVSIEFEKNPLMLRDLPNVNPLTSDAGDLESTLLRQPVHLTINGHTVLEHVPVSLFYLAAHGLDVVRRLPSTRYSKLEIPEGSLELSFEMSDDTVTVSEIRWGSEGRTSYSELLAAWEAFAERAREYLLQEFPGLRDHPEVGYWFRGEEHRDE